jgi:hypothetical protein
LADSVPERSMTCPFTDCERMVMARPTRVPVNRARSESGRQHDNDPNGAKTAVTVSPDALKLPSSDVSGSEPVVKLQFGPEGAIFATGKGCVGSVVGAVGEVETGERPSEPPPQPLRPPARTTAYRHARWPNILFMVRRSIHASASRLWGNVPRQWQRAQPGVRTHVAPFRRGAMPTQS